MKTYKKNNKNLSTSDLIAELETRSLMVLFCRLNLLQISINEYENKIIAPGALDHILLTQNKFLKEYSDMRDKNRKVLDIGSDSGREKLFTILGMLRRIKFDIYKKESFDNLLYALSLLTMNIYKNVTPDYLLILTKTENIIREITCEAIGYWTAKFEISMQNKNNVKVRTTKKIERRARLKEWINSIDIKDLRIRAQNEFQCTDRTILNDLQKIRDEETRIMRKKSDHA